MFTNRNLESSTIGKEEKQTMLKNINILFSSKLELFRKNFAVKNIVKIAKKQFFRNVLIVASGTAAAQAITMLFAPVITRLYGPEAFGVLGVFTSIVAILTPIAALTYPIAIVLPKEKSEATGLIRLSLYIAIIMSLLTGLIIMFFGDSILGLLQIEVLAPYLFFIPIVMVFAAGLQINQQWLIREKQFKLKAKIDVVQSILVNSAKSGAGIFQPFAATLILISTIGHAMHTLMLAWGAKIVSHAIDKNNLTKNRYKQTSLMRLAKKYYDFPIYRAPEVFMNAVSQNLPILMLTILFGPAAAGFYTIGIKVLGLPSNLIGRSVGDVYYPRISEAANNGEITSSLLTKATISLAITGLIPFGIVIIFGPWLFGMVFGTDWIDAGVYARWLAVWSFFGFINNPAVKTLPVLSAQRFLLIFSVAAVIARLTALAIGGYIFESDIAAIILFSIVGVILNAFLIIGTIAKCKAYDRGEVQ